MPKKQYPLKPGSTLELEWGFNWKNFCVRVDGKELGRFASKAALEGGNEWTLDDGSRLQVRLVKQLGELGGIQLHVTRDGLPVSGSDTDPQTQLKAAAGIAAFIGGLSIVLGGAAELGRVKVLLDNGLGWFSVGFGLVFLVLALAIRKGSEIALWVAILLFAVDGLLSFYFVAEQGGPPNFGGVVFRVALIAGMAKALGANKRAAMLRM